MDDKADAGITPRDWFAELTARIPNFVGYQSKDQRRTADKMVRDTMVLKLDDLREILSDVIEKANDAETSVVDDISKILRTMNELRDTPTHPDIMLVRGLRQSLDGFLSRSWQSELPRLPLSLSFLHTTPPRYRPSVRCSSRHRWLLRCSTATTTSSRQCTLLKTACPKSWRRFPRPPSKRSLPRKMSDSSATVPSIFVAS